MNDLSLQDNYNNNQNVSLVFLLRMINGISEPIFVKDRQHHWMLVNDAFCNFTGYSKEELIGKSDYDFFPTTEADVFWAKDELVFTTGIPDENEEFFTDAHGVTHLICTKKSLFEDEVGTKFLVGTIRNITQQRRIEAELQESKGLLEQDITAYKEAERALAEKARLAAFHVEINTAITQNQALQTILKRCTDVLVNHLDAAFARIWILNTEEQVLELQASSGMYTHIDGPHGRVPVGMFKIGLIAQECQPHLSNQVLADPRVGDREWARREGMVAFAGYPLMLDGNLIGVIAMFARQTLTESVLTALQLAANQIALGIKRIQAEQALKASERKYRHLIDTSQDIIWSVDAQGCWSFLNRAVKNVYGYEPEEMIGRHFSEFEPPGRVQTDLGMLHILAEESVLQYETVVMAKDGRRLHLLCNAIALRDETGNFLGATGTATNITELKQAYEELQVTLEELNITEEELRQQHEELAITHETAQLERRRYQDLFEFAPDGYLVTDAKGMIKEANYAAATLLCVKQNFLVGKPLIMFIARQNRQTFMSKLANLEPSLDWEIELQPLGSTVFPASVRMAAVYDSQRQLVGWRWLLCDITERKQAEVAILESKAKLRQQAQELEQALHELKRAQTQLIQTEKMSSLGQLVAGVAHEINNPVSFIYGNLSHADAYIQDLLALLQLYQKHCAQSVPEIQKFKELIDLNFLTTDLQELFQSMKNGAERIREIVLSLRSFSRLDEADMKAVDIHEGIDSTLMILQSRLQASAQRPTIEVIREYGNLPLVQCYAGQLNQVFMNILNNAIDALAESVNPQIHIQTQLQKLQKLNQVTIRITDNGLGISEAVKKRIFDPFFTTKPIGKGTGMGLAISYQIINKKHNGCLQCFSQPGKGAEFVITIPLIQKCDIHYI